MTLRVFNFNKNYIDLIINVKNYSVEKDLSHADPYLINIFNDRNYDDIISWLSSRMGGIQSLLEMVKIIKANNARSFKDNITIKIV